MKVRPIVLIVPLTILVVALAIGSSLLFRIFVLLIVIGLVGIVWAATGVRRLSLQSGEIPDHSHVGGQFKEELTVINNSKLPKILLKAEEQTSLPGHHNLTVLNLPGDSSETWESTVECRRRGQHTLGSLKVTSGDPFGVFSNRRTLGIPRTIIVYPRVVELPYYRSSFSTLLDFGYGASGRRIGQISPSASSVREMVSGDSQEHIHWRSTAHTGRLMVKVFDAEHSSDTTKDVWIVLDMQQSVQAGEGEESTEEYAVTVAASLVKKYQDDGMRVGLVASAEQSYLIAPGASEAQLLKMLESLAVMRAWGKTPVERLASDTERFGSGSTVVLVTPHSTESVLSAMRRLRNYGHSVAVVFLDCSSFGGLLSPTHMAYALGASGIQAYVVRKGDDLAKALDSRVAFWYTRYI